MTTIESMRAMIHLTRTALLMKVRKRRIIMIMLISVLALFVNVNNLKIERQGVLHSEKLIKQPEGPLLCPFMCLSRSTFLLSLSLSFALSRPSLITAYQCD